MRDWIDRYQDFMRRSWQVSIVGASIMLLFVFREVYSLAHAISLTEIDIFSNREFLINISTIFCLLFLVGCVFTARILILKTRRPYYQISATWFVAYVAGILYLWMTGPQPPPAPDCVADGAKICFVIYDSARVDSVGTYTLAMPVVSVVRSAVTPPLRSELAATSKVNSFRVRCESFSRNIGRI